MKWVDSSLFHLTLKFLGDIRPSSIPVINEALGRVGDGTDPFSLEIGGFGAFPTIRRPRVLWLGVEPTPALRCLKQDIL